MNKQKKLVIKVNYENADKTSEEQFSPERIEEWDLKKIAITLVLSILIMIGFYYLLFNKQIFIKTDVADTSPSNRLLTDNTNEEKLIQEINIEQPVNTETKKKTTFSEEVNKTSIRTSTEENKTVKRPVTRSDFVARSQLSYLVKNREPQGEVVSPIKINSNKTIKIYYFTEIKNMAGHIVFHLWNYNGNQIFKKPIKIKGPRWRAATYKTIDSSLVGNWQVKLLDDKGTPLDALSFEIIN